jgi:acyl-CoA synthetase (AMP-forming)/AMP-acid ligase II
MEEIPTASSGKRRIRILALHGTQGNNEITKMQLENINIREEDYDIVYIRGTIQERHGHPDLETMVDGPFYSWIDETSRVSKERSIREAVVNVHSVLSSGLGPFDGIYGFSTGALIAAIVANTIYDPFFKTDFIATGSRSSVSANMIDVSLHGSSVEPAAYNSLSSLASKNNMRDEETPPSSTSSNESLQFIILACAAAPFSNMDEFRRITRCKDSFYPGSNCDVPSFHIIATEDVNKTKSEDWAMVFSDPHLMYISSVHGIGRAQRNDHELLDSLSCFIAHKGHPRPEKIVPKYRLVSKASSISVMPHKQVALVRLDSSELPDGGLMGRGVGTTIDSLLKARPREKPFLYNARGNGVFTSYGQLSDFIRGDGNLSNLGVQCNEVVAYGCPAGATALAAVAFLSIASSAIAAPLAPNTSEADTLDILEQFDAKYLIMFEGVECPGVYAAFQKYSLRGNAKIVRAFVQYTTPGMFAYTKRSPSHGAHKKLVSTVRRISSNLHRSYNDSSEQSLGNETCVLLRTSGTTSRPKVVQLTQNALIRNGGIIASSLSLEENDVCYSVMPLFHIGGLSASIISTLVSGGTVCCETMQFNPERMIDALATSNPKPTWYSSVPTIHNATVDFIKTIGENIPDSNANSWENSKNANKYSSYGISSDGIWVPADRNSGKGHNLRFIRSGAAELSSADALALSQTYGGIPFIPTYSMSEQMPITQPPTGKYDMTDDRPGSVGVPIAASIAIVNGSLRPLWHGKVGEIAISGSTVMTQYLENPDADRKAFFYLPLDIVGSSEETLGRYFLTGDTGKMDRAGFITLNGRTKELIKKGGEQISPFEVEDVLKKHHWVQNAICFSVPSKLYGEAVGAALVLSNASPSDIELDEIISEMRTLMKKCKFDPLKWPMRWKIVMDEDLPRTESKKYIRIGLSEVLGLDEGSAMISMTSLIESLEKKASIDYDVLRYVDCLHTHTKKSPSVSIRVCY